MSIEKRIHSLVRENILAMRAYGVADPGDLVKLDAMENPFPWPDEIKRQWLEVLAGVAVNRYPDAAARGLKTALRDAMGIPRESALLLGNGSDELIQIIITALARPGAKIMAPAPSFVMYEMTARFLGLEFVGVDLTADFALNVPTMLSAIEKHKPAVIFLAYPNNPTGNLWDVAAIREIIEASPGLVVIDEAYHAFSSRTLLDEIGEYDNVVLMRTVSKMGLAGLRLGLLVGAGQWLGEFDKVRLPYNINSLTQASAQFALGHIDFLNAQTDKIKAARKTLADALAGIDGVTQWPSEANFILFRVAGHGARDTVEALKQKGVLIKAMHGAHPLLDQCLRVTVGTTQENAAFLAALTEVLAA